MIVPTRPSWSGRPHWACRPAWSRSPAYGTLLPSKPTGMSWPSNDRRSLARLSCDRAVGMPARSDAADRASITCVVPVPPIANGTLGLVHTDPVERHHRSGRRPAEQRAGHGRTPATRNGAGRPARAALAGAEGDETHHERGRLGSRHARESSSMTPMPDALSSAPRAAATVSRWAPTTTCCAAGSKPGGSATTFCDVPAPTGTPHESPAGTGTGVCVTA